MLVAQHTVYFPDAFLTQMREAMPSTLSFDDFLAACQRPLRRSIRVNTLKISVADFLQLTAPYGWTLTPIPWCEEGFWIERDNEDALPLGSTAASVTSCSTAEKNYNVSGRGNFTSYVLCGSRRDNRTDLHMLCGIAVVVNFINNTGSKTDLVTVRRITILPRLNLSVVQLLVSVVLFVTPFQVEVMFMAQCV